ncbi:MAG: hypothetical protein ACX98W_22330 [bacterium]
MSRARTFDEIAARCARWAAWRVAVAVAAEGYPPHSWEGRAQLRGGVRPQAVAAFVPHLAQTRPDPVAVEVERALEVMPGYLRQAVAARYLSDHRRPRPTRGDLAREMGLEERRYRQALRDGLIWLHGHFTARAA